jgi:hypothetical protein
MKMVACSLASGGASDVFATCHRPLTLVAAFALVSARTACLRSTGESVSYQLRAEAAWRSPHGLPSFSEATAVAPTGRPLDHMALDASGGVLRGVRRMESALMRLGKLPDRLPASLRLGERRMALLAGPESGERVEVCVDDR